MILLLACAEPPPAAPPPPPTLVLVSLDTTRFDGIDAATTPRIWALAQAGARFTAAFAHAPTTLSSHSSVWTGLDPHGHRVPRNGYPLPDDLPVLPQKLADAGWDTLGVIGASALARPMGMDRGFSAWDETLGRSHKKRHEASAGEVTARALAVLSTHTERKRFLFVHYYDAHAPWVAPEPWGTKWVDPTDDTTFDGSPRAMSEYGSRLRSGTDTPGDHAAARARYRGELSYIDHELGVLLDTLVTPTVVIFGDHGEAIGDLPGRPLGHGPDVDPVAVHVPLIVSGPGIPPSVIDQTVALSDVGATVLGLAGVSGGLGEGRDLAPLWAGGAVPPKTVLTEATQPHSAEAKDRWNNLPMERGAIDASWMLIRGDTVEASDWRTGAPAPEATVQKLGSALDAWNAAAPPFRPEVADDDTKEALKALGYAD